MSNPFFYETTIKFHETDAAGRLFFAHQLKLAHDAYEAFLEHAGLSLATIILKRPYDLPIVHAESDYLAPLYVGDRLRIQVTVERIGTSSFTLEYHIFDQTRRKVGKAKTVHVAVASETGQKITLPEEIIGLLKSVSHTNSHPEQ